MVLQAIISWGVLIFSQTASTFDLALIKHKVTRCNMLWYCWSVCVPQNDSRWGFLMVVHFLQTETQDDMVAICSHRVVQLIYIWLSAKQGIFSELFVTVLEIHLLFCTTSFFFFCLMVCIVINQQDLRILRWIRVKRSHNSCPKLPVLSHLLAWF